MCNNRYGRLRRRNVVTPPPIPLKCIMNIVIHGISKRARAGEWHFRWHTPGSEVQFVQNAKSRKNTEAHPADASLTTIASGEFTGFFVFGIGSADSELHFIGHLFPVRKSRHAFLCRSVCNPFADSSSFRKT